MNVGTRELRARLNELLERVSLGEEIVVHRRGRPAAVLVPAERRSKGFPSLAAFLARRRVRGRAMSAEVVAARCAECA